MRRFVPISTFAISGRKMAVDETAEVTHVDAERSDEAEARYRVTLEGVRNAVDLDDGVAYKVLNKGAHGPVPTLG